MAEAPAPLIASYDGIICDLDGVVYRGADAVPNAPEALWDMAARGVGIVYATNNASREPAEVMAQLVDLGAPGQVADVVTSAQAGAAHLARLLPPAAHVLALGGAGVAVAVSEAGLTPVAPTAGVTTVSAVLQGFGRQLRVADFEVAARLLATGAMWVACNADATLPLEWGDAPGNGAYVDLLKAVTDRAPTVVGKPYAPLYAVAIDRLGTTVARTLAVGDRLDTDIAGAHSAGVDSAWVLTGVDRPSRLFGPSAPVPTYVLGGLDELVVPYAAVLAVGDTWRCGGGEVSYTSTGLSLRAGSARPIELIRAGICALLEVRERGLASSEQVAGHARALDELATGVVSHPAG